MAKQNLGNIDSSRFFVDFGLYIGEILGTCRIKGQIKNLAFFNHFSINNGDIQKFGTFFGLKVKYDIEIYFKIYKS